MNVNVPFAMIFLRAISYVNLQLFLAVIMEFLDLTTIITIAVAVFVLLRLRSVLGQRTGHQENRDEFLETLRKNQANTEDDAATDNVVKLPNRKTRSEEAEPNPLEKEIDEIAKPRTKLNKGLKEILAVSPDFSPKQFLGGADMAYEMIVNAFADGDKKALNNLLSKEVYEGFSSAITDREKRNETMKSTFIGIDDSSIQAASLKEGESNLTIRFVSQIISATHDKDGNVIDGDENQTVTVKDLWTFSRVVNSSDPNWKLVATESEA